MVVIFEQSFFLLLARNGMLSPLFSPWSMGSMASKHLHCSKLDGRGPVCACERTKLHPMILLHPMIVCHRAPLKRWLSGPVLQSCGQSVQCCGWDMVFSAKCRGWKIAAFGFNFGCLALVRATSLAIFSHNSIGTWLQVAWSTRMVVSRSDFSSMMRSVREITSFQSWSASRPRNLLENRSQSSLITSRVQRLSTSMPSRKHPTRSSARIKPMISAAVLFIGPGGARMRMTSWRMDLNEAGRRG